MSDFKSVVKGGWHPKGKDGGKESWRGEFKGINQVAGWMGKGKQSGGAEASTHVSRPLATLKDPSAFGPPPKNVNYHGGAALPNEITPQTSGWGAPLSKEQIDSARRATSTPPVQEADEQKPAGPPLPYRADRTGLRTDNLPPPPTHKSLREPLPAPTPQSARPTPSLPPRLPSRQNTIEPPPPSYDSTTRTPPPTVAPAKSPNPILNQSAINRLGNAGVSVPGLGIGKSNSSNTSVAESSKPWKSEKSQSTTQNLSELQSRFSRMNTSFNNTTNNTNPSNTTSSNAATPTATSPQPQTQPQPPTWQQTRSALTTANSAYKDPSSVTLADAQSAAATAQSAQVSAAAFRERHNETINAAQTRASQLNKRYNMTGRLNRFLEDANEAHDKQQQTTGTVATAPAAQQQQYQQAPPANSWQQVSSPPPVASPPPQSATPELAASISRKPPPPPPPKKPASMQAPPPVPLGTKPNFN